MASSLYLAAICTTTNECHSPLLDRFFFQFRVLTSIVEFSPSHSNFPVMIGSAFFLREWPSLTCHWKIGSAIDHTLAQKPRHQKPAERNGRRQGWGGFSRICGFENRTTSAEEQLSTLCLQVFKMTADFRKDNKAPRCIALIV